MGVSKYSDLFELEDKYDGVRIKIAVLENELKRIEEEIEREVKKINRGND